MSEDTVYIDFFFGVPAATLWCAWTDPHMMVQWFGSDPEGQGISAAADAHPGKTFKVTFRNSDGTEYTCFGTYQAVTEPFELVFSWCWENEPDVTSLVSINFDAQEGSTLMHFQHANVGYASTHNYKTGWASTFEKLRKLVEQ